MKGCWFNYIRILTRKWKTFNLTNLNHEILQYSFAIPTLPAIEFENAIEQIEVIINDNTEKYSNDINGLQQFTKFLRLWWQPLAEFISYSENVNNSINISEYFDRHIGSKLGSLSPNIFQFSDDGDDGKLHELSIDDEPIRAN
ncbi:uncharacterized protein LOC123272929 [Cotesia glomerata]|uniref:uncharacterized protein LOC123272929 n=1 Tax=Cotesia glomerata TaxID=32391 RepID=UPI001D02F65F|nr:uncharacterized protein LOC123272929 [Cotesia glomerata]